MLIDRILNLSHILLNPMRTNKNGEVTLNNISE